MAVHSVTQDDILNYTGAMPFSPDQDFTITYWFKVGTLPSSGNWSTHVSILPSPALDSQVWLGLTDTGALELYAYQDPTDALVDFSGLTISTNTWYGVAATYEAETSTYSLSRIVDGDLSSGGSFTFSLDPITTDITFSLLSDGNPESEPGGSLAYVRIWQRLLSDTQILRELSSAAVVDSRQLVGDWPLPSISDTTDHGALGLDLTPTGDVETISGPTLRPRFYRQWRVYRMDAKPRPEETA